MDGLTSWQSRLSNWIQPLWPLEVMGNIDYMKDDLKKLVDMSQGSYIHDNMNKYHAMEEATMEHFVKDKKGKEKEQV